MKNVLLGWLMVCVLVVGWSGCAGRSRVAGVAGVVIPAANPDLPAVESAVRSAQASATRAGAAAVRAVAIAGGMQAADGVQEEQLARLRLELSTTVEELRLTEESLARSLERVAAAQVEIRNLTEWGVGWQRAAQEAQERLAIERDLVETHRAAAVRAGRERDVFVRLFAISLTVCGLLLIAPLVRAVAGRAGTWSMAAAAGMYFVAVGGFYLGSFWVIRWVLRLVIAAG